ncbi:uncharacterized protein LOC111697161 [Eurytemora carolleeae]|uniref:uncharacterized protein LOC111697161 n=1 Tax=Eurytemora carolleeae TaxID=1294199 RepID=UPI000C778E38|nr:uncharacterized protein LOC111697161 [Eurytemora carolleeae]|eukprot:XP_023322832.1 uncharacterized protein LOC111697161 [Eurytemora affinis]
MIITGGKMVIISKEPMAYPSMKIYRGNDPTLIEFPIKKTEDFFEKKGSFAERLKWGLKTGLIAGLGWTTADILSFSRITDRRAQIARGAFFTIPAVSAMVGFVALLEIAKKSVGREHYKTAFAVAAAAPATVYCVWRRNIAPFAKVYIPVALWGVTYQTSIDDNKYFGWGAVTDNPNDPRDTFHRSLSMFGEAVRPEFFHTKYFRGGLLQPADPGPTYAKFEK